MAGCLTLSKVLKLGSFLLSLNMVKKIPLNLGFYCLNCADEQTISKLRPQDYG